jgi:cyclic beta-1,2-glucan synthetase
LSRAGLDGRFGFYESIDYRPRKPAADVDPTTGDGQPEVVRAFFAHHQGMALVALANVLQDDVFVTRFHADPRVKATELLLQERVPREAILSEVRPAERTSTAPSMGAAVSRRFRTPHTNSPPHSCRTAETVALTHAGGGSSVAQLSVTRRRDDRIGRGAHFIYLRDPWSGGSGRQPISQIVASRMNTGATFRLESDVPATGRRRENAASGRRRRRTMEVRRLSINNRAIGARINQVTRNGPRASG